MVAQAQQQGQLARALEAAQPFELAGPRGGIGVERQADRAGERHRRPEALREQRASRAPHGQAVLDDVAQRGRHVGRGEVFPAVLGRIGGDRLRGAVVPDPDFAAAQRRLLAGGGAAQARFAEGMAPGAQGGMAVEGGPGPALGFGEFGRRGIAAVVHGVEHAPEVGGQVETRQIGAALGRSGHRNLPGAVEIEETHLPRRGRIGRIAPQADVLVAEVAMQQAGVVQAADGVGHGLEQVHQRRAARGLGVDSIQLLAQVGEAGHEGGDEPGFAQAVAFPAFGDGHGGGRADAGGAQEQGVAEGALGLAADARGAPVEPGGLEPVGLDDGIEGFAAARQREPVHAVAPGRRQRRRAFFQEEPESFEDFAEPGALPAGGDEHAPRAARLPDRLSHGARRPAWACGAGSRVPSAWRI